MIEVGTRSLNRHPIRGAAVAISCLVGVWMILAECSPAGAYQQRTNTPSVGGQAGLGLMSGSGTLSQGGTLDATVIDYEDYDLGLGISINVRYSIDRTHAIGFSFEDLRFERKSEANPEIAKQYQLNNFTARYYAYFKRKAKMSRYLVLGVGFHRPAFRFDDAENLLPGEGFSSNLGVGLEYFLTRPLAIDASIQGYYFNVKGGDILAAEFLLGIQYYLIK